jgi:hypothetical protein
MKTHKFLLLIAIGIASLGVGSSAQAPQAKGSPAPYKAPRNAFGQPDLEGTWTNNSLTPLQRPAVWANKTTLTPDEVELLRKATAKLEENGDALFGDELVIDTLEGKGKAASHDTETGNYNGFWLPNRDVDNRTSLIIDPPDGRLPPTTPESQARTKALAEQRALHPADAPESRGLGERCITFGVPRLTAAYSSVFEVTQSPDAFVFTMETIHDARVIPLGAVPHLSKAMPQWLGNSRGHWEGDTLVVETRGFSSKTSMMGATGSLTLVERFTRIAPDVLQVDTTLTDPATWTKPWTARLLLRKTSEPLIEYACHEGNHGLAGILAGARKQEAAEAAAKKGSTN